MEAGDDAEGEGEGSAESASSSSVLCKVAEYLAHPGVAGSAITHLVLRAEHGCAPAPDTLAPFLQATATACPNLTSTSCGPLPSPPHLPALRSLAVHMPYGARRAATEGFCSTITPLMTQITSLELSRDDGYPLPWEILLTHPPTNATNTLTHLTTGTTTLDNQLLTLLLQHAPSLTHLCVEAVRGVEPGVFSKRQWGVGMLRLDGRATEVASLCGLPKSSVRPVEVKVWSGVELHVGEQVGGLGQKAYSCPSAAHVHSQVHALAPCVQDTQCAPSVSESPAFVCTYVCVCMRVCVWMCDVLCVQGIDASIVERLPEWSFHTEKLTVISSYLDTEQQPAALRAALRQMQSLQVGDSKSTHSRIHIHRIHTRMEWTTQGALVRQQPGE